MGILTTPGQADALCTVIALGYIIGSKEKNTYIIFEEGKKASDDLTKEQHSLLRAKLAKLAGKDLLEFKTQRAIDKFKQPLIFAHTGYSTLQPDIAQDELLVFGQLEKEINENENISLKGAYVGGALTTSKTELLDPSILYWYDPKYRKPSKADSEKLKSAESNASSVTKIVQNFLEEVFKDGQTLKHGGARVSQPPERPLSADISNKSTGAQLFASVHGMTQSIIHYSRTNDKKERVNIELALGRDTCKVASCIPCSMFMSANETPASATHFGRGDNWNFPPSVFELIREYSQTDNFYNLPNYAQKWVICVQNAYKAGKACFENYKKSLTTKDNWIEGDENLSFALQFKCENSGEMQIIPQLFLEALTFESSFLNKMLSTLKNMPM